MSEQSDRYFARQGEARPEGEGSFLKWDEQKPIEVVPGLTFQPVLGDQLMANFVYFEPNTEAPLHWHIEEQISFVVDGEFEFEVAGEKRLLRRGEAGVIPPNVPHAARTFDTACLEVDVFYPPRQGLLDAMGLGDSGAD